MRCDLRKENWLIRLTLLLVAVLVESAPLAHPRVVAGVAGRITSLDPLSLGEIEAYDVTGLVIEPLARIDPKTGKLLPWLAESWTFHKESKTLRVKLKQNLHFQDGSPLRGEDVQFTFEAYHSPEALRSLWAGMWREVESAKATDSHTVEFRLKSLKYSAYLNLLTSLRVLSRSFYKEAKLEKRRTRIVGSGPFRLHRFLSGQSVELEPFPGWWRWSKENPPIDFDLTIKSVTNPHLVISMISKGELDKFTFPSLADTSALKDTSVRVLAVPTVPGEGLWISLNLRRSFFASLEVRQALLFLWDRKKLNDRIYGGRYELAADTFSPQMPFYPSINLSQEAYDTQLAKARSQLKAAGWTDSNRDSILDRHEDGKRKDFVFTILVGSAEAERWVTLYQADAARAGVQVKIKRVDESGQFLKMLQEGQFDAVAGQGGVNSAVDALSWRTNGTYNFSGYSNAKVDALLDQLEGEFDLEKRQSLDRRLIELVRQDLPQIPGLYSSKQMILLSKRLQIDPQHPNQPWHWHLTK